MFGTILIDDQEAIKKLNDTDKQAKNASKTFDNMANMGLKIGGAVVKGLAVAGAAIGGMIVKGVHSADNISKAINGIESATGLADDSTTKFKDSLLNIYKNNFGESYEDIANAMTSISQQTGLVGDELERTTQNALILRDTFGFEVNESMRAANQLVEQFGISSEEAFNLVAQGAQAGLDKNGDMLDSINEYAVHFEQLGLNAEDMFNVLDAGAQNGAFSIDKVGDAFKEFGIRVKDGSETTSTAFETLGLNSEQLTAAFSAGGEKANDAYYKVYEALIAMDDPVQQNAAGVALFGTMWEDLGAKATLAAMGMSDAFNGSVDTMSKINEIKYDSFGEALSGIGRQFEVGVFLPLGEKVLPKLNEFANYTQENMPQIQETIDGVMSVASKVFDTFTSAVGFATDNLGIIIPIVAGFAGAMTALSIIGVIKNLIDAWKVSTFAQTLAQGGLNAALMANPIGIVITIIGALIAIGVALYMNWDTVKAKALALWSGIKTTFSGISSAVSNAMETAKTVVSNAIDKIKGFLNFNWSWPKIPLPHFSISGSVNPLKWLDEGTPKIAVDWYAKGGIFSKPTIFNTPYGLKGVGDASSPEVVAPLHKLQEMLGLNNNNSSETEIIRLLNALLEAIINKDNNIYLDGQVFAKKLSPHSDKVGGTNIRLLERGLIV